MALRLQLEVISASARPGNGSSTHHQMATSVVAFGMSVLLLGALGCGRRTETPAASKPESGPPHPAQVEKSATQPSDQGRSVPEKGRSDGKAAPVGMCYTVEQSDGQFAVVIHNSPLGKYKYPIPNLNGIFCGATDDKKHYISVSAFQGEVESVTWNETKIPNKKDGAK